MVNSTEGSGGRLGNQLFRNVASSILAEKFNLKFTYGAAQSMNNLGIRLFTTGEYIFDTTQPLNDSNYMSTLNQDTLSCNVDPIYAYFQTQDISHLIRNYMASEPVKSVIIHANLYKSRYQNNNDVYVHVRLGDAAQWSPSFEYYDMVLSTLSFGCGYLSSDMISHNLCQRLMEKYNLKPLNLNQEQTIMMASTCKYIVLSSGTFSWTIGVLGFYSDVYYPNPARRPVWHGDIFVFDDWQQIDYDVDVSL